MGMNQIIYELKLKRKASFFSSIGNGDTVEDMDTKSIYQGMFAAYNDALKILHPKLAFDEKMSNDLERLSSYYLTGNI